jgi:uncharacterized protein
MSLLQPKRGRLRQYIQFLVAVFYFFLAQSLAQHGALGLANDAWSPMAMQAMLLFLLTLGYAAMGFWLQGQLQPIKAQGWPLRPGWSGEAGRGLAVGWGVAVACVLPLALAGGIAVLLTTDTAAWGWLVVDAAYFALAAAAEEVAFRGYGFQRLRVATSPLTASLAFAVFYAFLQGMLPGSSRASTAVSIVFSLLLSAAYLRTRALWVSWGLNFGWKASRALLFGLTVSGVSSHSSVIEGNPMGPSWLTGGGFGLDGSWWAFVVFLVAFPVVFRVTRELDYRYNAPVLEPAGVPVDLSRAAEAQHKAAMGDSNAPLVQIGMVPPAIPRNGGQESAPENADGMGEGMGS